MATASFTKSMTIREPEAIVRFTDVASHKKSTSPVNKDLTSEKTMERGKQLLQRYLSR